MKKMGIGRLHELPSFQYGIESDVFEESLDRVFRLG
jgi:hypothetical protein